MKILTILFLLATYSCKKYTATCTKYDGNDILLSVKTVEHRSYEYVETWIYGFKESVTQQGLKSSCSKILTN